MPPDIPGEWIELADYVALTAERPDLDVLREKRVQEADHVN